MGPTGNLPTPDPSLLRAATYQIATSERGLPTVQLSLQFSSTSRPVANPDMTLAVLINRSGSMGGISRDERVLRMASAILDYVSPAGVGYDLICYDNTAADRAYITTRSDLRRAIIAQPPGSDTSSTTAEVLRRTIQRYRKQRGIYVLVITGNAFADKDELLRYVGSTLLAQLTPENPYACRLHFVSIGREVDRDFLRRLEVVAGSGGIQFVKYHHGHMRHSHADILAELDSSFLGIADQGVLGQDVRQGERVAITRVGNVATRQWRDGNLQDIGFVPRRATLGLEYDEPHPDSIPVVLRCGTSPESREVAFTLPLPRSSPSPAAQPHVPVVRSRFHLPWRRASQDEEAPRTAARQERAVLAQRIQRAREAEALRQARDLLLLVSDDIPAMARQRLAALRAAPGGIAFTSDLSPAEVALVRRNGYRPLGLVSGSTMYHVGTAYTPSHTDCEVEVRSQAYNNATRLAVRRMEQEATALGAHGVIGVRFDIVRHEWSDQTVEVRLLGTAIAGPGRAPAAPWLSVLTGQEWWALYRAGYEPVGLVCRHCVWFVLTTQDDEWTESSRGNRELRHMSRALSQARSRALQQVESDARRAGAVGVVGVRLSRRLDEIRLTGPGEDPVHEREHHNLIFSIIGTAIHLRAAAPRQVRATVPVVSLRDGRLTPYNVSTLAARVE